MLLDVCVLVLIVDNFVACFQQEACQGMKRFEDGPHVMCTEDPVD